MVALVSIWKEWIESRMWSKDDSVAIFSIQSVRKRVLEMLEKEILKFDTSVLWAWIFKKAIDCEYFLKKN